MRSPALRNSRHGYTAVEVLMAMTVMAIGAAAVISMQKASVQGNLEAHEADVAASVARMWVDRLQRDAMQWTLPNGDNPTLNNFSNAKLLSTPTYGTWGLPQAYVTQYQSYGFDILGRDLPAADLTATNTGNNIVVPVFCVNYRLQWLVPQSIPGEPGLIRADVRVLWPRGINNQPAAGWCNATLAAQANPDQGSTGPTYHSLYVTTTLREGAQ